MLSCEEPQLHAYTHKLPGVTAPAPLCRSRKPQAPHRAAVPRVDTIHTKKTCTGCTLHSAPSQQINTLTKEAKSAGHGACSSTMPRVNHCTTPVTEATSRRGGPPLQVQLEAADTRRRPTRLLLRALRCFPVHVIAACRSLLPLLPLLLLLRRRRRPRRLPLLFLLSRRVKVPEPAPPPLRCGPTASAPCPVPGCLPLPSCPGDLALLCLARRLLLPTPIHPSQACPCLYLCTPTPTCRAALGPTALSSTQRRHPPGRAAAHSQPGPVAGHLTCEVQRGACGPSRAVAAQEGTTEGRVGGGGLVQVGAVGGGAVALNAWQGDWDRGRRGRPDAWGLTVSAIITYRHGVQLTVHGGSRQAVAANNA